MDSPFRTSEARAGFHGIETVQNATNGTVTDNVDDSVQFHEFERSTAGAPRAAWLWALSIVDSWRAAVDRLIDRPVQSASSTNASD